MFCSENNSSPSCEFASTSLPPSHTRHGIVLSVIQYVTVF